VGDFDHDRLPSRLSAILCEVFAPGWRQQCGASITEPGSLHSEAQTACRRLRPVARKREASKWCPATSLTYKLTSGLGGRRRISTQAPPPNSRQWGPCCPGANRHPMRRIPCRHRIGPHRFGRCESN